MKRDVRKERLFVKNFYSAINVSRSYRTDILPELPRKNELSVLILQLNKTDLARYRLLW